MTLRLRPAESPQDMDTVRALFREYQALLGVDLCFQHFEDELLNLPGAYAPPGGALILAENGGGAALGCVGLRPGPVAVSAELKRLYVRPAAQGQGAGRALLDRALAQAAALGYREVWLDSLRRLTKAEALYRAAGFEDAEAYNRTPEADVYYLKKRLS